MRKKLDIDNRVKISGSPQDVENAEKIITENIPDLAAKTEAQARLLLMHCVEDNKIRIRSIMFDGNGVCNKQQILKAIRKVKKNGMKAMTYELYQFLHLSCGSIAHYNMNGWIQTYPTVCALRNFFKRNEFGERVLNYLPVWRTDAREVVGAIERQLKALP